MLGCARPIAPYARLEPKSRGQRRGILWVDARTREGRLLRDVRNTLLEHLGGNATAVHKSLIERGRSSNCVSQCSTASRCAVSSPNMMAALI